ncbi:alpha-galactosidase [Nocardioides convexus]|uniref:alpha-galactosidase n=1 Tax=Nocardioides convexus TaxID=2712224 RepID=UPI0024182EC2|nr:alpha-galactosidase [Nocardioides convexus]
MGVRRGLGRAPGLVGQPGARGRADVPRRGGADRRRACCSPARSPSIPEPPTGRRPCGRSTGAASTRLSGRLHAEVRARATHPRTPRKVLLNSWQAVYFKATPERLLPLVDAAAAVGVERFVVDDGWFRGRTSARAGLGDWEVDRERWPDGLDPLVRAVTGHGMDLGLWVEPEMVNPDSDLARAHPDWILSPAEGDLGTPSRFQHVLDLARPDAYAHVAAALHALLDTYPIAYLKWDHNRPVTEAGHGPARVPGVRAHTLAAYRLMDELKAAHPGLEIESCASGGARIDLGVLARTDRVWASDCIDALDRQEVQRWTQPARPARARRHPPRPGDRALDGAHPAAGVCARRPRCGATSASSGT